MPINSNAYTYILVIGYLKQCHLDKRNCIFLQLFVQALHYNVHCLSRLTGSESQGQEEAACAHLADTITSVLFTVTNVTMKFPNAVTQSS